MPSSAVIKMACALLKALEPCYPLCQVMLTSTKDEEMNVSLRNVGLLVATTGSRCLTLQSEL